MNKIISGLFNNKLLLVIFTLVVTVILVPVGFNFLFLWESGFSKGFTSDWFVLYGGIFSGLIGGLFTYLALVLTLNNQKEEKRKELKPRLDIPYQSIDFIDGEEMNQIAIELNNIGGTIAKNIECKLSLLNFNKVIDTINKNKENLKVDLIKDGNKSASLIQRSDDGRQKSSLGSVKRSYNPTFIGSCVPMVLNHNAKVNYLLDHNVNSWIDYIIKNRRYSRILTTDDIFENELFKFRLEVTYSSADFGKITDIFILVWDSIGIWADSEGVVKYQYVLRSSIENE